MRHKKTDRKTILPRIELTRSNLIIFIVGLVVIAAGFYLLSLPPWNNPLSLSVAPVVLLIGYLVIFPVAIFYGSRSRKSPEADSKPGAAEQRRSRSR